MKNEIYANASIQDKRLIDVLDNLLWAIKNPSKVDHVWRLRVLEKSREEIEYALNKENKYTY